MNGLVGGVGPMGPPLNSVLVPVSYAVSTRVCPNDISIAKAREPRGQGGQLPTQLYHWVGSQCILSTQKNFPNIYLVDRTTLQSYPH